MFTCECAFYFLMSVKLNCDWAGKVSHSIHDKQSRHKNKQLYLGSGGASLSGFHLLLPWSLHHKETKGVELKGSRRWDIREIEYVLYSTRGCRRSRTVLQRFPPQTTADQTECGHVLSSVHKSKLTHKFSTPMHDFTCLWRSLVSACGPAPAAVCRGTAPPCGFLQQHKASRGEKHKRV